jgi:uncharacterized protein YjbI with pentapeptide repeats
MDSMTRFGARIIAAFRDAVANKTLRVATALALAVTVAVSYGIWLDWEWKAMIGWKALEGYSNPAPDDATGKKEAVQVYVVIVAGVIASITAAVGLANLRLTRKNLEQQRELEAQRAQGTALQAYYEQIGKLITEFDLRNTQREEIRELARGQTLTVLQEVDGNGRGSLLTFLYGAGLIGTENPAVVLTGAYLPEAALRGRNLTRVDLGNANLWKANLQGASLWRANLSAANLQRADLRKAILEEAELQGANLQRADLREANLQAAYLQRADLREANLQAANLKGTGVTDEQLDVALSLQDAILPDGTKHR